VARVSKPAAVEDDDLPIEASRLAEPFPGSAAVSAALCGREARVPRSEPLTGPDESFAAERAEIDRLKSEAQNLHREAARTRDRTRKLAVRHARHVKQKWSAVRAELDTQQKSIEAAREQFSLEAARFQAMRSQFHAAAVEAQQRLHLAWEELETHRQRAADEWQETNEYISKQEAIHAVRAAEVEKREKAVGELRAKIEQETAGLRQEAAGLEARTNHARSIVEELERRREELHAELLAAAPRPDSAPQQNAFRIPLDRAADRDLTKWSAELDAQDRCLVEERANLARLKSVLDREATQLADERKVLAEQFALLAAARSEWQEAEGRTMAEMEELAQGLRTRDEEMVVREERVQKAEARRREEGDHLHQLRARLEAWQSKLTSVSRTWHFERERRERDLAGREKAILDREALLQEAFDRWEQSRVDERERLAAELQLWSEDRAAMARAGEEYDRRARASLDEIALHAARAMAAEDLLAETVTQGQGTTRRFDVLLKRWERVFAKKLAEIDTRRSAAAADLARLGDRYVELHRSLQHLAERETELNGRAARLDAESARALASHSAMLPFESPALYEEPLDDELPWASEEVDSEPVTLPFAFHSRAA
jgi:hypothetical protein